MRVSITISGGVLTDVMCDGEMELTVFDFDDIKQGGTRVEEKIVNNWNEDLYSQCKKDEQVWIDSFSDDPFILPNEED